MLQQYFWENIFFFRRDFDGLSVKTSWFTEIQVTKIKSIGWFAEGKRISITRVTESYLLASLPPKFQLSSLSRNFPLFFIPFPRDSGTSESSTIYITVFCLLKFHVARKKLQYREFYSLESRLLLSVAIFR